MQIIGEPQARRHILKKWSGGRQSDAKGTSGGEYERGMPPLVRGFGEIPRGNFDLWVPLSVFFMHFGCVLGQNSSSVVLAEIFGQNNI